MWFGINENVEGGPEREVETEREKETERGEREIWVCVGWGGGGARPEEYCAEKYKNIHSMKTVKLRVTSWMHV